jgi:hypothetical protein
MECHASASQIDPPPSVAGMKEDKKLEFGDKKSKGFYVLMIGITLNRRAPSYI